MNVQKCKNIHLFLVIAKFGFVTFCIPRWIQNHLPLAHVVFLLGEFYHLNIDRLGREKFQNRSRRPTSLIWTCLAIFEKNTTFQPRITLKEKKRKISTSSSKNFWGRTERLISKSPVQIHFLIAENDEKENLDHFILRLYGSDQERTCEDWDSIRFESL